MHIRVCFMCTYIEQHVCYTLAAPARRACTSACRLRSKRGSAEGLGRTSNHLGAVGNRLLTVEGALRACETLADYARVFIHSRGRTRAHEPAVGRCRLLGSLLGERAESTHPFLDNHSRTCDLHVSTAKQAYTPTVGLVQTQTARTVHHLRLHEHDCKQRPFPCVPLRLCSIAVLPDAAVAAIHLLAATPQRSAAPAFSGGIND